MISDIREPPIDEWKGKWTSKYSFHSFEEHGLQVYDAV
jgi:hypothetical protein